MSAGTLLKSTTHRPGLGAWAAAPIFGLDFLVTFGSSQKKQIKKGCRLAAFFLTSIKRIIQQLQLAFRSTDELLRPRDARTYPCP